MNKLNIIFLDIDGVLNVRSKEHDEYGSLFHDNFVDNLKCIVDETNAKIVISSSWRHSGLLIMQEMWEKRKLPGEVIDVTCNIRSTSMITFNKHLSDNDKQKYRGYSIPRGCEIEYWLKEDGNFQRINWSREQQIEYLEKSLIKNYIIIDDDSDMLYSQKEHFVKTSCQYDCEDAIEGYGLTKKATHKAIEILKTDIINLYYK